MKKAIKDLQPGDILPATVPGAQPSVVVSLVAQKGTGAFTVYASGLHATPTMYAPVVVSETHRPDTLVDVEPRVSAYELESLILIARNWIKGEPPTITARNAAQEIVNKLSPPNPPTYEELLDAVKELTGPPRAYAEGKPNAFARGLDLINRARNAGVLK